MSDSDLRGSTPIFTAKDVLIEVRDEVRGMKSSVDILVSQDLGRRVDDLERSRDEQRGFARVTALVAGLATLISTAAAVYSVIS